MFFKKLQKEIEVAIRNSDVQKLGSLDIKDTERCFFALEYLPLMKEFKMTTKNKKAINPKNSSNAA